MATDPLSSHYNLVINNELIEVADIQRAFLRSPKLSAYVGHCLATALKYIFRAPFKGDMVRDLVKAAVYVLWAAKEANGGAVPSEMIDAFAAMVGTPKKRSLPEDMFPPVRNDICRDDFCPISDK